MALTLPDPTRNDLTDALVDPLDSGAGPATIRIYSEPRPSAGSGPGSATELAVVELATPAFGDSGANDAGFAPLLGAPRENEASDDGTAAWFRAHDGDGTGRFDGSVGTSGADLIVDSTSFSAGVVFRILSGRVGMPSGE